MRDDDTHPPHRRTTKYRSIYYPGLTREVLERLPHSSPPPAEVKATPAAVESVSWIHRVSDVAAAPWSGAPTPQKIVASTTPHRHPSSLLTHRAPNSSSPHLLAAPCSAAPSSIAARFVNDAGAARDAGVGACAEGQEAARKSQASAEAAVRSNLQARKCVGEAQQGALHDISAARRQQPMVDEAVRSRMQPQYSENVRSAVQSAHPAAAAADTAAYQAQGALHTLELAQAQDPRTPPDRVLSSSRMIPPQAPPATPTAAGNTNSIADLGVLINDLRHLIENARSFPAADERAQRVFWDKEGGMHVFIPATGTRDAFGFGPRYSYGPGFAHGPEFAWHAAGENVVADGIGHTNTQTNDSVAATPAAAPPHDTLLLTEY